MVSHDYTTVEIERTDGVATVVIDGSNAVNALDLETTRELHRASIELVEDSDIRCIALTGSGDVFGVGADLTQLAGDASDAVRIRHLASTLHDAIVQLHQAEKPVVTAVNGMAAGAGFSLALCGDLVLVSETAQLKYAYPQIGLPGDGGATFLLPRLVGLRQATKIALLDEPIDAEQAVDLGLATELVSQGRFEERLDEVTAELAAGPTKALGMVGRLMAESFERDFPAQLAAETDAMGRATRTDDYARGLAAFLDDSEPEFTGR